MKEICKFCLLANNQHEADCSRDTPNANALYDAGLLHAHSGRAAQQPNNPAYMAGYSAFRPPDWSGEMFK